MDDSCQDFEDACSKLLKRVRKKQGEPRQQRKEEKQPSSQASDGARRNQKKDGSSGSGGAVAEPFGAAEEGEAGKAGGKLTAKDKVLERMQKFKRATPQKMVHGATAPSHDGDRAPPPARMKQDGKITDVFR